MVSKKFYILIFLVGFITSSCEDIVNNLIECGVKDVELKAKVLKKATLNQNYFEVIKAGVKNDNDDDSYQYSFSYDGALPDGITASSSGRSFELRGIATEVGTFTFQVNVDVAFGSDTATCYESASNSYTLVVN